MKKKNLLPNIILSVILIGIALTALCYAASSTSKDPQDQEQTSLPAQPSVVYVFTPFTLSPHPLVHTENLEELQKLVEDCNTRKDAAHSIAEAARVLGYSEDDPLIRLSQEEWMNANKQQTYYEEVYNKVYDFIWRARAEEFPEATQVWLYFKELGYNDYVCAGIMGNLMAEVGGLTLSLQPTIYGQGYYGMCQWNMAYKDKIWGKSLEAQCDFLASTIKYEIDIFGYVYKKGFNFEDFLALEDAREAALVFAKTYERCAGSTYSARQRCAQTAYEYFVD